MIKIVMIYFFGVILTTFAAYIADLCNEDEEIEWTVKRIINLIFGVIVFFLMIVVIRNWTLEVKKATTFLEIIKTTLINTVYFLLLTVFGNAVSKNMTKIKTGLTIARLKKIWREKGGKEMKKILLGIVVMGILGSCANWEDTKKDWESSTEGLKRKVEVYTLDGKLIKTYEGLMRVRSAEESSMVSLNLIEEGNRRIMIDNAIVIIEEK